MEIPVYLFTGFLESGKTKFIQETLEDVKFNNGERMLLLVFEEGMEEYDPSMFSGNNISIEIIDDKTKLNPEYLEAVRKKAGAERVLAEYNGMWLLDDFYKSLPESWLVYQEMLFVDSTTFISYNTNMRSLVVDKLKSCEMCIFNRFDTQYDMLEFHKIVRATNRGANIAYEYKNGFVEYDDIEDPCPFDKNADIIEIKDEDFAYWYRDFAENVADYTGKTVKIHVVTVPNKIIDKNTEIIVGRHIMTCCQDDIAFKGLLCKIQDANKFAPGDWIDLTAKISMENHKVYSNSKGPVLTTISAEKTIAPESPVATFF